MKIQERSKPTGKTKEVWEEGYAEGYINGTKDLTKAVSHLLDGGDLSDLEIGKYMSLEAVILLNRLGGTDDVDN